MVNPAGIVSSGGGLTVDPLHEQGCAQSSPRLQICDRYGRRHELDGVGFWAPVDQELEQPVAVRQL